MYGLRLPITSILLYVNYDIVSRSLVNSSTHFYSLFMLLALSLLQANLRLLQFQNNALVVRIREL